MARQKATDYAPETVKAMRKSQFPLLTVKVTLTERYLILKMVTGMGIQMRMDLKMLTVMQKPKVRQKGFDLPMG
jgi:hypothetical protein